MKRICLAFFAVALMAGDEVPGWVRDVAAQQTPAYPSKVVLVTLLSDVTLTVGTDGRQITHERGAVKVLQKGRSVPGAYCYYNPKTGKVREFQAWLLPPSGKPAFFGKKGRGVVDLSAAQSFEEYDEGRYEVIEPGGDLAPGTVFAWEILDDEKTVFTADEHRFQEDLDPMLVSRYSLTVPTGWVASATLFNHDAVQPRISGTTYTWELRNLPWIEPEEHSPEFHSLAPRLGVNYYPEDSARSGLQPALRKWRDVSAWEATLMDPAAAVTDAIRGKAAELTKGAATELDKIRAVAAFVQKTNYVAVSINLAHGGGLTPNPADQTLARNYGDCKDKATLMRSLLRSVGIEAYPVSIYYGDRQYVRTEWPSPFQFNHAIIAIRVSPETKLPTVVQHPVLGRLLIFDPTDPVTPVGNLPELEQGSYALVVAGSDGDLITMPMLPPELNRVESKGDAQFGPNGSLTAHLQRLYYGQQASHLRYMATFEKSDELKRKFEEALSNRLGGLTLQKIESADRLADDQFQPRTEPVRLNAEAFRDSVTIAVPPNFKVDELPDPVQFTSAYGSYQATWKADGNKILFEQSLEVKNTIAPAAQYAQIRQFFAHVDEAQNSAVVLVRQ